MKLLYPPGLILPVLQQTEVLSPKEPPLKLPVIGHLRFSQFGDNKLEWILWYADGQADVALSTNSISTNTWTHVAVTFDTSTKATKFYINGVLDGTYTVSFTHNLADTPEIIKIGYDGQSAYFSGIMDDVRYFNSVLTADQVKLLYNQGFSSSMGVLSTASSSATMTSSARSYCPPGDTGTCNPPVGEWKLDEGNWNGTAGEIKDTSGNNLNGVSYNNATTSLGKLGNAGKFDGVNQMAGISYNSLLLPSGDMTLEAWVRLNSLPVNNGDRMQIAYKHHSVSPSNSYFLNVYRTSGVNYFQFTWRNTGGTSYSALAGTPISTNIWYHVVGIKSGTSLRVYVNGADSTSSPGTTTGTIFQSTSNLNIGSGWTTSDPLNGLIDNVILYDYTRTPAQVAWDYNRGEPIGHWRFDEGSGDTANNSSEVGSSINGDLAGSCPGASSCPTWTTSGKLNGALTFDGSDDYVQITDPGSNSVLDLTNMSVSVWFYLDSDPSGWVNLVGKGDSSWNYAIDMDGANSNKVGFGWWNDGSNYSTIPYYDGGFTTQHWYHVVGTYDDITNTGKLYVNGSLVANGVDPSTNSPGANNNDLLIGAWPGPSQYFPGKIDDVKIFNYPLTPEQVKTEYNQGALHFGP